MWENNVQPVSVYDRKNHIWSKIRRKTVIELRRTEKQILLVRKAARDAGMNE